MNNEVKLTKSVAEVYLFENLPHGGWAKFTVQDMGSRGRISIASDYGDWQNGWGSCGKSFKSFLGDLNMGYAADKFNADGWFDADATIAEIKKRIIERRLGDSATKEEARLAWDEMKDVLGDCATRNDFLGAMRYECDNLMRFFNWDSPFCETASPGFKRLWKEVWPLFIDVIQKEIAVEDAPVSKFDTTRTETSEAQAPE